MSDTHSLTSPVDGTSSLPAFSADDLNIDPEESEFSSPHSLGGLPYSGGVSRQNFANTQQRPNFLYSPSSDPLPNPAVVESNPGLLYSFSDTPSDRLKEKETRPGVIDSFGITSQLYKSAISRPRPNKPPQQLQLTHPDEGLSNLPGTPDHNSSCGNHVDSSNAVCGHVVEEEKGTYSPDAVPRTHQNSTPLLAKEEHKHGDVASWNDTPTPEAITKSSKPEPTLLTESSSNHLEPVGSDRNRSSECVSELAKNKDDSAFADDVVYLLKVDSDAAETCSVVSVQQLAEDYLIEPADFDYVTPPVAKEQNQFVIPLPATTEACKLKAASSPNTQPSRLSVKKFPSPGTQSKLLPSPIKVPAHIQKCEMKSDLPSASRTASVSSSIFEPSESPYTAPSFVSPSKVPAYSDDGGHSDHERELEDQLVMEQKSRMHLTGQLEALTNEYETALRDRSGLLSRLSRAEAELVEVTSSLEKEKTKNTAAQQAALMEGGQLNIKPVMASNLEDVVVQEKKISSDLQVSLAKERHKSDKLEQDLEDIRETLCETEAALIELKAKLKGSQVDIEKKADESEQRLFKLSSLEASYNAMEKNKQWLHEQLQDGLKAKLKLQEELREAKASGIAQEIRCDQIQKENSLLQQQVHSLRKGVLQDKENLVNQLEEIEAAVLSREDQCSNLVAEKGQLEKMVGWKEETVSHLNSDLGRAQVKQEELQKELDETTQEVIKLTQRADALGKDNRQLTKKLKDMGDMEERESDYKELEKVKESLQERLRLADVEIVGKDGIIHNLTEARDMLQCEVDLVSEAKECVEKELEDAKCEVAVLEAEIQSSIFKNREKDILVSDSMESQNSLEDQHAASLAVKDREIEKKEEVVKNLEDQIGDLVKEFGVLQTNFQSLSSESGTVNDSIAEKDRVIAHLASLKDRSDDEISSLSKENQELRDNVGELQHEMSRLQGQVEGSVQHEDYQKSLQNKTELQAKLNTANLKHQQDQIRFQAKTNRLERELKEARKSLSGAKKDLEMTQDRHNEEVNKLKAAKHQLQSDLKELENELQRSLVEKEKTQEVPSSSKPSQEHLEVLKAKCDQLSRENKTAMDQLQQEIEQRKDVERASGLVAAQLKKNSDQQKKELLLKNREQSLDIERLRGKLVGVLTTQATLKEHAASLEVALAKKEAEVVRISAQMQKLIEEKVMDEQTEKAQAAMEELVKMKQAEVTDCQCKIQDEKMKVDGLVQEVVTLKAEISSMKTKISRKNLEDISSLKDQVTDLSLEKEVLQSDLSYFKSQHLIVKTLADSAKREVADKVSQVEILERELAMAVSQCKQANEEVRQLKEHMRSSNSKLREAELMQCDASPSRITGAYDLDQPKSNQAGECCICTARKYLGSTNAGH